MKIENFFTPEELALIDSGEYRPGRVELDAKLDFCIAAEREACAQIAIYGCMVPPDGGSPTEDERLLCEHIAHSIRARGEA